MGVINQLISRGATTVYASIYIEIPIDTDILLKLALEVVKIVKGDPESKLFQRNMVT